MLSWLIISLPAGWLGLLLTNSANVGRLRLTPAHRAQHGQEGLAHDKGEQAAVGCGRGKDAHECGLPVLLQISGGLPSNGACLSSSNEQSQPTLKLSQLNASNLLLGSRLTS